MNNKFKRAISSVLAFVMLFSSFVVMNVGNVFADTTAKTWSKSSDCFSDANLYALATKNTSQSYASYTYSMDKKTPNTIDFDGLVANDQGLKLNGSASAAQVRIYATESEQDAIMYLDKRGAFQVPVDGASRITFTAKSNSTSSDATIWRFDPGVDPCIDATEDFEKVAVKAGEYAEYTYDYTGTTSGYVSFLVYSSSDTQAWLKSVSVEPAVTTSVELSCADITDYSDVDIAVYDASTVQVSDDNVTLAADGTLTVAGTFVGDIYTVEVTANDTLYEGIFSAATDAGTSNLIVAARTNYAYQFNSSYGGEAVITDKTSGTYYLKGGAKVDDAEGAEITLTNAKFNDTQHGLAISNGGTIVIDNIVAPVKVTLGRCQYGGGQLVMSSGVDGEKDVTFTNSGTCGKTVEDTENVVTKYYNGSSTKLTISAGGTVYLPFITVTTIKESEIPSTTDVDGTVTGLNTEDASLAYLVFTNTEDAKDVQYASVKDNAFNVTLSNDATYSVAEFGGNSSYTVTTESFNVESTEVAVTANAVGTAEVKSYKYNFTGSKVMPQVSTFKYGAFTTDDGILTMTDVTWHDKTHGITDVAGSTYKIKVASDCSIAFTSCKYSSENANYVATADAGEITEGSQATKVQTDGDIIKFSYSGPATTVTITANGGSSYVHQLSVTYNIEYSSDVYLGYTDGSTPNYNDIASAIDVVNSMPGTDAVTLHVAQGTYNIGDTPLAITRANVTVVGSSADDCVIVGDFATTDTGISDTSGGGTIHNGTIVLRADNIAFENMTIENGTYKSYNSTALEIYSTNSSFKNCAIKASCDTIYTGSGIATSGKFEDTLITGYQDVVYGGGEFTFDNCTFRANAAVTGTSSSYGTARFFAPTGTTANQYKFEINNITIASEGGTNPIYFARPWSGSSTDGSAGTLVINSYTIDSSATARFNTGVTTQNLAGFDLGNASSGGVSSEKCLFFVKKNASDTEYVTTLKVLDDVTTTVDSLPLSDTDSTIVDVYTITGTLNSKATDATDVKVSNGADKADATVEDGKVIAYLYNTASIAKVINSVVFTIDGKTASKSITPIEIKAHTEAAE